MSPSVDSVRLSLDPPGARVRSAACRVATAALLLAITCAAPVLAQSQAVNGAIEGTVADASGGLMPGVSVTVTNTDTGATRTVVTNERGVYRALLLPLGAYRLDAELSGFKKYSEKGISLSAGQTVVVDVKLEIGEMTETVSVTAEAPVVDAGRIDMGRNMGEREVKNLPLVSRNPYNFALLQPGVTGYENPEFGVPRFSANGTLLRINYQIDGNTNTQKDRAGLRLIPMSEVMIREVKVVTSGYAPEFGQTTGMVYNAITPSGTNTIKGSASYRFRRKPYSAFPFFFQGPRTADTKPDTKINTWTADVGGPVVKDKLHFYFGFESTFRDLSSQRILQIAPAAAAQIGLTAQPPYVPWTQTAHFYIGKLDYQLARNHTLTGRFVRFSNDSPYNNGGGLSAYETTNDYLDAMNSTAVQLNSTFGSNRLNEFRAQYADRENTRFSNSESGTGTPTTISGVATFGGPTSNGARFKQGITQVIDNFTWLAGDHNFKFGFDGQFVHDERATALYYSYTFPTIDAYLAAKNGTNPRSYSSFQQVLGDPNFMMDSKLFSFYWQDDWRLTPNLKVLYGVRYDLYLYPKASADAPFEYSRKFSVDKNNFGPRLGLAWTLGESKRTVLRASTGIMYDQALLGAYENSIDQSGSPVRWTVNLAPGAAGAPAYPGNLADLPPGFALPVQSIFTVDPAFVVGRTLQNNIQLERGLGRNYSMSVGLVYVRGYNLPVVTDINLINPVGALADGRPIFSTAVNAGTRMDPRFNHINTVQSLGTSTYKAITFQFARRVSKGVQFDVNYSFGKGVDDAPASGNLSFVSDDARSDPTNLQRDKGPNLLDTRHSFQGSVVANPTFDAGSQVLNAIINNNQVALMMQFNSGLPFTIRGNRDLNLDGNGNDRPLDVGRNSIYLPARWNVDMRYSRYVPISGPRRLEIVAEFKNVLNTVQWAGVNRTVQVDTAGNPLLPIPTDPKGFPPTSGYEQREFQLGFKFSF